MTFIKELYPEIFDELLDMYKTGYAPPGYRSYLAKRAAALMKKHGITGEYAALRAGEEKAGEKKEYEQISLFDKNI